MEGPIKNEIAPEIEVIFDFSLNHETERVSNTLKDMPWYKENDYKIKFPKKIREKLEKEENINFEDISLAVSEEFNPDIYNERVLKIKEGWKEIEKDFFENLKKLNLPIQEKYFICTTIYGTGGSYHTPNSVHLNIDYYKDPTLVIAHEIVHLTIEPLIQEFNIDHWTKERIVNLIMNKFFPEKPTLQRDPENAEKVSEIFETYFPDIRRVIGEISKIKK